MHHKKRIDVVSTQMIKKDTLWYLKRKINCPDDAADIFREFIGNSDREKLVLIGLNTKNEPTIASTISIGSLNSSIIHPREVFKPAIIASSASIIIGHNHPSGHIEPSQEDINVTKRMADAGEIIGIPLLDHIIVTDDQHISIKNQGYL